MHDKFAFSSGYTAQNAALSMSAGMSMTPPGQACRMAQRAAPAELILRDPSLSLRILGDRILANPATIAWHKLAAQNLIAKVDTLYFRCLRVETPDWNCGPTRADDIDPVPLLCLDPYSAFSNKYYPQVDPKKATHRKGESFGTSL